MDGIDAALVDFTPEQPQLICFHQAPYPDTLRKRLLPFAQGGHSELDRAAELDVTLGHLFADAARSLLQQAELRASRVAAIGSHGQTLRHCPEVPTSIQAGDPNIIASRTGITTVADFRRRDMSVGGQGAPLTPAFHNVLFRIRGRVRVVLNIGGIANITILPARAAEPVAGFDTGPGNTLMDRWTQRHLQQPMDVDGRWAAGGQPDPELLARLLRDPYFRKPPPKSTGPEHFNLDWLDRHIARESRLIPQRNVQATLCELTARSISTAIREHAPEAREVIVCGGGVENLALMFRLQVLLDGVAVQSTHDFGVDPRHIEAMTFAWLARQTLQGNPGNLPSVTGARQGVILGAIYPA